MLPGKNIYSTKYVAIFIELANADPEISRSGLFWRNKPYDEKGMEIHQRKFHERMPEELKQFIKERRNDPRRTNKSKERAADFLTHFRNAELVSTGRGEKELIATNNNGNGSETDSTGKNNGNKKKVGRAKKAGSGRKNAYGYNFPHIEWVDGEEEDLEGEFGVYISDNGPGMVMLNEKFEDLLKLEKLIKNDYPHSESAMEWLKDECEQAVYAYVKTNDREMLTQPKVFSSSFRMAMGSIYASAKHKTSLTDGKGLG